MAGEEIVDNIVRKYDEFITTGNSSVLSEISSSWDEYFTSTGCGWCKQKSMEHKWQSDALKNAAITGANVSDLKKAAMHMRELAMYQRDVSGQAQEFAQKIKPLATEKVTNRIREIDERFGTYTPPPSVPGEKESHMQHPNDASAEAPATPQQQEAPKQVGKVVKSPGEPPFVGLGGYEIPEPTSIFDLQLVPSPDQLVGSIGDTFSLPKPPALPKPPSPTKLMDPLGLFNR
jgi:hypothetical protein